MNAHTFGVATVDARFGIFSPFLSTKSSVPGIPAAILNAEYYRENMNPNLLANYLGVRSAHEIPFTYFYIHDPNPNAYVIPPDRTLDPNVSTFGNVRPHANYIRYTEP